MTEPKDFAAGMNSDARKTPVRVAFITRRTSAHVKAHDEAKIQTFPEVLFRAAVAVEVLAIVLILISLFFNAPLEGLADPTHTPNPAKAPWYFLGLQELLHYFPPVVAGVLVPTLVVLALIVIPYFNINVEAEGLFTKNRQKRVDLFWAAGGAFWLFLVVFAVMQLLKKNVAEAREFTIVAIIPTTIMLGLMARAAYSTADSPSKFRRMVVAKPLSYWIMTWFLFELVVLTTVGTLFRGPGWSWVWPWSGGIQ